MRTSAATPIEGTCDTRFHGVREAFRENFAREGELGAAVCAIAGGRIVADLWGGYTDEECTRRWERETLINAFSTGKGVLAMLALGCVEAKEIGLDAPLEAVWPELLAAGRGKLTLRGLLSHRAGLPAVRLPLGDDALFDWDRMCSALAAQEPYWLPGSAHGYHVNTFGFLVGEVLRRVTGQPLGRLARERLSGRLGVPFYWGVPPEALRRIAPMFLPPLPKGAAFEEALPASDDPAYDAMIRAAHFNPPGISGFGTVNTRAWRSAAIPSANAHTHARALAHIYEAYRCGRLGVGSEARAEASRPQSDGEDLVLRRPTRFGLGFQLPHARRPIGPSPHALGHFGHGGSLGLADPVAGLAFGYVNNLPGARFQTPRANRLLEALYAAL